MNKELLYVDISKSKKEEDLIEIRLGNEEVAEINFSKLFNQSRYLRDKYKYSECIELIQEEIHHIKENTNVCDKSMKLFIELVSEDKIKFPIEHYKDIYTLSEYFCIPTITTELDKISRDKLFQDLNFTIQTLLDYERLNDNSDSKLQTKIESILKTRINECLSNPKFKELSNSTIFRILEGSKEEIDHNLLIEFIIESASTRFVMFKFIEIDKLRYDKFQLFIKFIENQEETNKKMYLDYIPFNFSFIQNILNKYDEVLKEMNGIKEELKSTKIK